MTPEFYTENDVTAQVVNTVACTVKIKIPNALTHRLEAFYEPSLTCARRMLRRRKESSSKYYREIPCVLSKSLIAKYQRNPKCRQIRSLVLPVCGDQGRQIKLVEGGVRIPALFKKEILAVDWPREIVGHVRSAEFFRREGQWFASICYNTRSEPAIQSEGVVGVDRNSVGNIAVMADLETGKVFKLGISPAPTKRVMRGRRKNLQRAGKFRFLSKLRRKQRRRMTHENHRASKTIVDYAARHRRAVAIEKLENVRAKGSKIRRYSESNQWAFAQLETFLRHKAALRGVPILEVDPAYTSQTCSKCGNIHKPNGKRFLCATCGHNEHRDANSSFVIAQRAHAKIAVISGSCLSVQKSGSIGDAQAGKAGAL